MRWLMSLILTTACMLVACGTQETVTTTLRNPTEPTDKPTKPTETNDSRIQKYVDEFKQRCIDLNHRACLKRWTRLESVLFVERSVIQNEPGSENRVGVCYVWEDGNKRLVKAKVQILQDIEWNDEELKGLVYHELGHCALGLDHTNGTKGHPTIMNPYLYHAMIYIEFWEQMVSELFAAVLNLLEVEEVGNTSTTLRILE